MFASATTTVSVLGGTTTDQFGDTLDGTTVVAGPGLPASILEQRQLITTSGDDRSQVVRYYTGRLNPVGFTITQQHRILDDLSGDTYAIENVSQVANLGVVNELRLDLRKV